jgi:hypothetical protein
MPDLDSQQPFYNVMPEAHPNKAVSPQRQVNSTNTEKVFGSSVAPDSAKKITMAGSGGHRSYNHIIRNIAIAVVIVIVLGAAAFGVWKLFFNKTEPVLAPDTNTAPQQITVPDVSTPGDWLARYFGTETCVNKAQCGDSADPDRDGYTNKEEYTTGTDPNNPDSDGDGIADGDEAHVFSSDPLISRTYRDGQYNDADFVKGSYDIQTNTPYTDQQLADIKTKVKDQGLHQPTLTTIGALALSIYDFQDPEMKSLEDLNIDLTPQAKLDRDTQRQTTIKKIGGALLKYKQEKDSFPVGTDFTPMSEAIGPYNTVATNYFDPINKLQYIYGYESTGTGVDFTLTYYSETQNQLIKYTNKDAETNALKDDAQTHNQQRIADLENIKSALLIYSSANVDSNSEQINVFPTKEQYPSVLLPHYISAIPKDPNGSDYVYDVNENFTSFTLKAVFDSPATGTTGYICNELECKNY